MTTLDTLRLLILIAMLAFLAGLLVYFKKHPQWQLSKLYLPCVLFWGLVYTFVFIPFTAPDEYAHYASAYRLSNQIMLKEFSGTAYDETGHVMMREDDTWELGTELSGENYAEVYRKFWEMDDSQREIGYGHHYMEVAFHAYTPQAIGITVARLLGLGQVLTIYLGRLCNLLFFVLCGWLAVRVAPFGKMAFFGTSLLPMTLELVGSLSYDGFAIGLGMLFTAYVMHLIYEKDKIGPRQWAILGVLLALLAPCKMVYIPLAAMCFLIPQEKFGTKKRFVTAAAIVATCMVAGVLIVNLNKMTSYLGETEGVIDWAGGVAGYSFSHLLQSPLTAVKVIAYTLVTRAAGYVYGMIGGNLGWLEYEVDAVLVLFLLAWTALTALAVRKERQEEVSLANITDADGAVMPVPHRMVSLALCFCTVIATLLIMLLSWTPLGSPVVEGVQGRYFLPILPLVLVALRNKKIVLQHNINDILIGGYCLVNLLVIQWILAMVV